MINQSLVQELQHELAATVKMLKAVPQDKLSWKPHEKSMTLGHLAAHLADMPHWITVILTTEELDFATNRYHSKEADTTAQLVHQFEEEGNKALETLQQATDETMMGQWALRNGSHVIMQLPRVAVVRSFGISHLIHHRGQLSVYLRLLNVAVPGMYGPSADERM